MKTNWNKVITRLKQSKQIYHNEICDFYIYKEKMYHFKSAIIEVLKKERLVSTKNKTVTKQVSVIYFLQHNETRKIKIGYKPSQSLLSVNDIATRENAVLLDTIQASPSDFNRLKKCLNYSQTWVNCPFLLKFIKSLDDWCKCCNALMKINISQLLDLMEVIEYRKQKG